MENDGKTKEEIGNPLWQSLKPYIHPALDFVNDVAVITQPIPYSVGEKEKEYLTLITSDRKHQRLNPETTDFNIAHLPQYFPRRWQLGSIKAFIEEKETKLEPKRLLKELKSLFAQYIEFPEIECYDFFPLWIMGTYLHPLFKAYPYVYVGGISQTGKTKVLNFCSCLSFNSIFSGNMSSASLFRLIQNNRCSLFIDETEKLNNPQKAEDFRNILLNGYKKGSLVYRVEKIKDSQTMMSFEAYSPKMLANIQGLEDVLESRCISFIMKRTFNREIGEREVDETEVLWQILRDQLYFFSLTYWREIKAVYDDISNDTELKNRDWELWKPIFAIAKFIDADIYREMMSFAVEKSKEAKDENIIENTDYQIAEALIKKAFELEESKFIAISEIKDEILGFYEDNPKWLNNTWVGKRLRKLGFKEGRSRGKFREIKLDRKNVVDLAKRLDIPIENAVSNVSNLSNLSNDFDTTDTSDTTDTANSGKEEA